MEIKATDAGVELSYVAGSGYADGVLMIKTKDLSLEIELSNVRSIQSIPNGKRIYIAW
jgi:hypothetical protein